MDETKAAISERGFRQFAAFFAREPLPEEKFEFWMARLIAAVAAPWQKKGSKGLDPRDLMVDWWGERKKEQPQTVDQWKALFRNFTRARGGKVLDSKGDVIHGPKRRQPRRHHQRQRQAADGGVGEREKPGPQLPVIGE